jgi:hypothetical protein
MAEDPTSEQEHSRLIELLLLRTTDITIRMVALTDLLEESGVFTSDEYRDKYLELLALWNNRYAPGPADMRPDPQVEELLRRLEPPDGVPPPQGNG